MKTLKHFALAFLHLFSFVTLMYFQNNLHQLNRQFDSVELWFMAILILGNAFIGCYHLARMVMCMFEFAQLETTEGWDGD
jgi:hypothetical protein